MRHSTVALTDFAAAAGAAIDLVRTIPAGAWAGPGLGGWDLRALVGHTSRSFVTVLTYLSRPADSEDIATPADYYRFGVASVRISAADVLERGRQAGRDLGADPPARFAELAEQAVEAAARSDPDALITTIAGGMRVGSYLPTRTFELVVHSADIAAATGLPSEQPRGPLQAAVSLAATVAVDLGRGYDLLLALTGRRTSIEFSVV